MKPSFFSSDQLQVKICGIKSATAAQDAILAGASALGFNLYPPSKRFLSPQAAMDIAATLPREVARIAVVVNPTPHEMETLLQRNVFDAIQFHGDETPELCQSVNFPIWIKTIQVGSFEEAKVQIASFSTPYILLDADTKGAYGGTGKLINLPIAAQLVAALPNKRFLLAGGLHPENVREAVQSVRPAAVDVASGVEDEAGNKIPSKIQAFIAAAQLALI